MSTSKRPYGSGVARGLSKLGYCSRSDARNLVASGRVRLNGRVVRDPSAPFRPGKDRIEVDGKAVIQSRHVYLMMNKPRGIVTTARDEKGRSTIYSLLESEKRWLAPVGRLDKASEGLLLLTNDSEWAERITLPESHIAKTYHVQINTVPSDATLKRLRAGVEDDRELLKARSARVLRQGTKTCWLEIVLEEGKNRQIRRMLAAFGIEVLRLVRVAIGPLRLGELAKGKTRELTSEEVRSIMARGIESIHAAD